MQTIVPLECSTDAHSYPSLLLDFSQRAVRLRSEGASQTLDASKLQLEYINVFGEVSEVAFRDSHSQECLVVVCPHHRSLFLRNQFRRLGVEFNNDVWFVPPLSEKQNCAAAQKNVPLADTSGPSHAPSDPKSPTTLDAGRSPAPHLATPHDACSHHREKTPPSSTLQLEAAGLRRTGNFSKKQKEIAEEIHMSDGHTRHHTADITLQSISSWFDSGKQLSAAKENEAQPRSTSLTLDEMLKRKQLESIFKKTPLANCLKEIREQLKQQSLSADVASSAATLRCGQTPSTPTKRPAAEEAASIERTKQKNSVESKLEAASPADKSSLTTARKESQRGSREQPTPSDSERAAILGFKDFRAQSCSDIPFSFYGKESAAKDQSAEMQIREFQQFVDQLRSQKSMLGFDKPLGQARSPDDGRAGHIADERQAFENRVLRAFVHSEKEVRVDVRLPEQDLLTAHSELLEKAALEEKRGFGFVRWLKRLFSSKSGEPRLAAANKNELVIKFFQRVFAILDVAETSEPPKRVRENSDYKVLARVDLKIHTRASPFHFASCSPSSEVVYVFSLEEDVASFPFESRRLKQLDRDRFERSLEKYKNKSNDILFFYFNTSHIKDAFNALPAPHCGVVPLDERPSFCEALEALFHSVFKNNYSIELFTALLVKTNEIMRRAAIAIEKSLRENFLVLNKYKFNRFLIFSAKYYLANIREFTALYVALFSAGLNLENFYRKADFSSEAVLRYQKQLLERLDPAAARRVMVGRGLDLQRTVHTFVELGRRDVMKRLIPLETLLEDFLRNIRSYDCISA